MLVAVKFAVATVEALARNATSPLLLPLAVVISHSHWMNRYSLLSVTVAPGVNVTTDVTSAVVDSAADVVPTSTALVICVAPVPAALVPRHSRTLTRPACDDAVVARTANVIVQLALAKMPLIGFSERQLSPLAGTAAVVSALVVENVPDARLVPNRSLLKLAEAILATVQLLAIVLAPGSTSDSEPKPLTATFLRKSLLEAIYSSQRHE